MRTHVIVALAVALSLTACGPRPPLRYVETCCAVMVHPSSYAVRHGEFRDSALYRVWQRRQAEISGDMRYHHGCYPGWC